MKKELKRLNKLYQKNLQNLIKFVNTLQHHKYLVIERILNQKIIEIQSKLGILIPDPCPFRFPKTCNECSGYYKIIYISNPFPRKHPKRKLFKYLPRSVQCSKNNKGSHFCFLKKYSSSQRCLHCGAKIYKGKICSLCKDYVGWYRRLRLERKQYIYALL